MASVVDQNGDELFPRKWNSDFIDAPVVEKQNQPSVTSEQIEQAIAKANDADAVLYILLASSGLRIGKALALRIGPSETSSYFSDAAVTVHTSLWRRREQDPKQLRLLGPLRLQDPLLNASRSLRVGAVVFFLAMALRQARVHFGIVSATQVYRASMLSVAGVQLGFERIECKRT